MGTKENTVQRGCLYMLGTLAGCFVERCNTGAARVLGKGGKPRMMRFGTPGAPDLRATVPPDGHALAVECKSLAGRQSPEQREWQRCHEAAGGTYLLCRSTLDLEEWLRTRGLMGGFARATRATHPELFDQPKAPHNAPKEPVE